MHSISSVSHEIQDPVSNYDKQKISLWKSWLKISHRENNPYFVLNKHETTVVIEPVEMDIRVLLYWKSLSLLRSAVSCFWHDKSLFQTPEIDFHFEQNWCS